jgi:hypothetical protein
MAAADRAEGGQVEPVLGSRMVSSILYGFFDHILASTTSFRFAHLSSIAVNFNAIPSKDQVYVPSTSPQHWQVITT